MARTVVLAAVGLAAIAGSSVPSGLAGEDDAAKVETVSIATVRGPRLEATLHRPAKPNGVAVVLAPGQEYHRGMPILLRGAEGLAAAAFTALRFDWAYFASRGNPSADLANERDDLEAVIGFVRALPGIKKVVLAGKSQGSMVVLARAASNPEDLAGLALLTLPLHAPGSAALYTETQTMRLLDLQVPSLVVSGDADRLASLPVLYGLLAKATNPPRLVVVPGGHGFEKSKDDSSQTADNVSLAVSALVLWCRRFTDS